MSSQTYGIKVLLEVLNKSSGPLSSIGASLSAVSRQAESLGRSLDAAGRKAMEMGKSVRGVGSAMSVGLTLPILAFGGAALAAWDKQAKAEAQVEQGLKSTGGAAKLSLEQLKAMASDIQKNTLFGDEEILAGATAQLLTFTNISGDTFKRTQQAIVDVASRLAATKGGAADLTGTSIMLGKALNDPSKGLMALQRVGISFTEQQKQQVGAMQRTGNLAGAQKLILKELETQYGGSAAAAAAAGTGGFKQLQNQIGDLMEVFGKLLFKILAPLIPKIQKIVENIDAWTAANPELAHMVAIFALMLAAIGPIIWVAGALTTGFGAMMVAMGGLSTAFAWVTGTGLGASVSLYGLATAVWAVMAPLWPLILGIAALAGAAFLIYKYWDPIRYFFVGLWVMVSSIFMRYKRIIMTVLGLFIPALLIYEYWGEITGFFSALWNRVAAIFWSIVEILKPIGVFLMEPIMMALFPLLVVFDIIKAAFYALVEVFKGGWSWMQKVAALGKMTLDSTQTQKIQAVQSGVAANSENRTEVMVKVQADANSTATVAGAKNLKGKSRVQVDSARGASFSHG